MSDSGFDYSPRKAISSSIRVAFVQGEEASMMSLLNNHKSDGWLV